MATLQATFRLWRRLTLYAHLDSILMSDVERESASADKVRLLCETVKAAREESQKCRGFLSRAAFSFGEQQLEKQNNENHRN